MGIPRFQIHDKQAVIFRMRNILEPVRQPGIAHNGSHSLEPSVIEAGGVAPTVTYTTYGTWQYLPVA